MVHHKKFRMNQLKLLKFKFKIIHLYLIKHKVHLFTK